MKGLDRRALLGAGAGIAAASALDWTAFAAPAAAAERGPNGIEMRSDGSYATVPLAKETISLAVAQTRVVPVELGNVAQGRRANVQHMLDVIDMANGFSGPKDLIQFHEFPITGYRHVWNLEDARKIAIEIPGEETELLAAKAREYGSWIVFGSYVRDPDWPKRLLSITTIISDKGEIVAKDWKARNLKGFFPGGRELFTTTIYDVLDEYVERYGWDHVVPVIRTPIGNLFTSSSQLEPELFRAAAMKGAEIMLRTASGNFNEIDIRATSMYNRVYSTIANNSASPENRYYLADSNPGHVGIVGPDGEFIEQSETDFETLVYGRIPIASFRARHRQPIVHSELVMPVFDKYRSPYGPNLIADYQPTDTEDAGRYLRSKSRWPQ
ncbi:nitrilase-related carbon-nitrogen hydrolase [Altererythrobacter arenosus]|uniref:Nitrilase-related carbon-nitrogen hydrolase n=1 Tax=Altererythrobacter arenosus TaxID=3032592 RepID=A0ABY8FQF9_9SPHN|nr:nitrilase-related carbon-nitrogen hydrolase [Altererythrobacter sp. CAU 1644]WFL76340.1 nitrilase-related carbon-nitrogen hydrolase [Altererythrobacter sp. CAU 1644]